ncbi:MAG: SAM hydrolase/SAM-dependent halogenase family protein [Hydrogenobaculum sp.]
MIALLTDFGTDDPFVGIVKGVIYSVEKNVEIIDITHNIDAFNVLKGAFYLSASYKYFPKETVFMCVVDPGVGSSRLPIACKYKDFFFVGPMNGIFDMVFEETPYCVDISNHPYVLKPVSSTFHGRDIFAPASAWIHKLRSIDFLGPSIKYQYSLNIPKPTFKDGIIEGVILFYDRFGNAITNVKCTELKYALIEDKKIDYFEYFSKAPKNYPGITCGSFGYMEFFINQGSFKDFISAKDFKIIT